jgi:hypothetical protein
MAMHMWIFSSLQMTLLWLADGQTTLTLMQVFSILLSNPFNRFPVTPIETAKPRSLVERSRDGHPKSSSRFRR